MEATVKINSSSWMDSIESAEVVITSPSGKSLSFKKIWILTAGLKKEDSEFVNSLAQLAIRMSDDRVFDCRVTIDYMKRFKEIVEYCVTKKSKDHVIHGQMK